PTFAGLELTHPRVVVDGVVLASRQGGRAGADEPSLLLLPQAIALAADVQHVTVVQEAIEDRRGDDAVAEDLAPLAEALVRGQDDAAALVARRDEREEGGGRHAVIGPHAELVDDKQL